MTTQPRAVVVGAGIGGLAAAVRLAHAGMAVTVLERQASVGGKMRVKPSAAGPVDTGPTVLTLRRELDSLFRDVGRDMEDYVSLQPQHILARHFWPDGGTLDLTIDPSTSEANVCTFAGPQGAQEYRAFRKDSAMLFDAFDAPMMQADTPRQANLTRHVMTHPWLVGAMAPWATLAGRLGKRFSDPRLAQLFGRYATYVGGSPFQSPALLSLIAEAEARGVWAPANGMHAMAQGLARLATELGADIRCEAHVDRIEAPEGRVTGVWSDGALIPADVALFNGDPRALSLGMLGEDVTRVAPKTQQDARSLSAMVWAFAATPQGVDLAHHNVFFSPDSAAEWRALDAGHMPETPTLYICALDRGSGSNPPKLERFEIILNAPPLGQRTPEPEDYQSCLRQTFQTLARFGLTFTPTPDAQALTLPQEWEARFPGSDGSLYGQSPHGMTAGLRRPTARTEVPGLYLVGGGAHPGAGVPMAILSARHAAGMITRDLTLTSTSPPMATRGGMSTG